MLISKINRVFVIAHLAFIGCNELLRYILKTDMHNNKDNASYPRRTDFGGKQWLKISKKKIAA